jgi:hypothetical protein
MFALARGWLSFISCVMFVGPVIAAGACAAAVVAVLYLSFYVLLVMPLLCMFSDSRIKCFPRFFATGECSV